MKRDTYSHISGENPMVSVCTCKHCPDSVSFISLIVKAYGKGLRILMKESLSGAQLFHKITQKVLGFSD